MRHLYRPEDKQWLVGTSGNPKGRPKKIPDQYTVLKSVVKRKVKIKGHPKKVTILEALIHRLRDEVVRGDKKSFDLLESLMSMAAKAYPHQEELDDIRPAYERLARMVRESQQAKQEKLNE